MRERGLNVLRSSRKTSIFFSVFCFFVIFSFYLFHATPLAHMFGTPLYAFRRVSFLILPVHVDLRCRVGAQFCFIKTKKDTILIFRNSFSSLSLRLNGCWSLSSRSFPFRLVLFRTYMCIECQVGFGPALCACESSAGTTIENTFLITQMRQRLSCCAAILSIVSVADMMQFIHFMAVKSYFSWIIYSLSLISFCEHWYLVCVSLTRRICRCQQIMCLCRGVNSRFVKAIWFLRRFGWLLRRFWWHKLRWAGSSRYQEWFLTFRHRDPSFFKVNDLLSALGFKAIDNKWQNFRLLNESILPNWINTYPVTKIEWNANNLSLKIPFRSTCASFNAVDWNRRDD